MEYIGSESPVVIGQAGPLNGQRWVIDQLLVVGRVEPCDVVIPDRQVSRSHARFTLSDEDVILEDLGSKNGTYCNGDRVKDPIILRDGDIIQIAMAQNLVFLSSDATMPMEISNSVIGLHAGRLCLEEQSRRVWIGQREIVPPLSAPQFRLLQALYDQNGKVVSRQELIVSVWGSQEVYGISDQALDALIRRLRNRLSDYDPNHPYVITVRGHGLRLDISAK